MPLYTRWEKTKPLPDRSTPNPHLKNTFLFVYALYNEVTIVTKQRTAQPAIPPAKRPNPAGIKTVLFRFVKYLKESLD